MAEARNKKRKLINTVLEEDTEKSDFEISHKLKKIKKYEKSSQTTQAFHMNLRSNSIMFKHLK